MKIKNTPPEDQSSPLFLGLDCSTTACKVIIWDMGGNCIGKGVAPLQIVSPKPGWYEQDAETWWSATVYAVKQATAKINIHRLKSLCIAHQRETFVPVDGQGSPLTNAILWMDERAYDIMPQLESTFDQDTFHHQTGKHLSVNLTIAKIVWMMAERPDIFRKTEKYLDVHAYLVHRMTGRYITSWGSADPTGLFDIEKNCWSESIIDQIGLKREQLPELSPPGKVLGELSTFAAEACGLPPGLLVISGLGDGQACGLGVNITSPHEAYLSLGTSQISGSFSENYITSPAFRTMTGGITRTYILETVLLGGAYTLSWFMETVATLPGQNITKLQEMYDQSAKEVPPGSQGLIVLPYWNSVLGPYWDPGASGMIIGLRGFHQRQHIYRAILEGLAYEQRLLTLGVEKALGQPIYRFIAIGGGAGSNCWCQIIADITNKPVYRSSTAEAAALGAGILAASGAGVYADPKQAAQGMVRDMPMPFEPDPSRQALYLRLFEQVYSQLFPAIRPYMDRLADLSGRLERDGS